jgi:glutaredoxin
MIVPIDGVYTIYTKSECVYCDRVKEVLKTEHTVIVNCDEILEQSRDEFLTIMDSLTHKHHRTFPFVFHHTTFIGGCDDVVHYLKNNRLSFDDDF